MTLSVEDVAEELILERLWAIVENSLILCNLEESVETIISSNMPLFLQTINEFY